MSLCLCICVLSCICVCVCVRVFIVSSWDRHFIPVSRVVFLNRFPLMDPLIVFHLVDIHFFIIMYLIFTISYDQGLYKNIEIFCILYKNWLQVNFNHKISYGPSGWSGFVSRGGHQSKSALRSDKRFWAVREHHIW